MANYNSLKNAAIITPVANTDLGTTSNRYGNVYLSGNINLNGTSITSTNVITPKVAGIGYVGGDDTAADIAGGQTITLYGTGFSSGANVLVNGTLASSTSVISPTQLTFTSPAMAAGSYVLYVINSDGGTAISLPGIQYSGVPAWSTSAGSLASAPQSTAVSVTVAATGDAPVTYSVFSGALPSGVTLNSSTGVISGVLPAVASETVYNFTIRATDAQLQDTNRSFSMSATIYVGKLWIWGSNYSGNLGLGDTVNKYSPVQVGAMNNWDSATGQMATIAIKSDGTLWTWGWNIYGQLGLGDTIKRSSPVQVGTLTNWSKAATTNGGTIAVKTDGTLWTWGNNNNGELGDSTVLPRSSPVQVGSLNNWSKISGSAGSFFAIKTNGTLWSWGNCGLYDGILGLGDTTKRSSPTQVGALANWKEIANGSYASLAVKTDGTLWSWGSNQGSTLGLGADTEHKSSPVQVGTLTTWISVACNYRASHAIKTNGTLWAWGLNWSAGVLGLNQDVYSIDSPTQVGALTNWQSISRGSRDNVGALKTNGTIWTWGWNGTTGSLGQGDTIHRSSPVQVGSLTNWLSISGGYNAFRAISS